MDQTTKYILPSLITMILMMTGCSESDGYSTSKEDNKKVIEPIEIVAPVDPYKSAGWYGRTTVSATAVDGTLYKHTTGGIFGELIQSNDGVDKHDIPAYSKSIFQVVMIDDKLNQNSSGYFSNYKYFDKENRVKRVWTFQIRNEVAVNLSQASIRIELPSLVDVLYKEEHNRTVFKESSDNNRTLIDQLTLVDVDNAQIYTVEALKKENLSMDGLNTRTFRWVLGDVEANDYLPVASPARSSSRVATKNVNFTSTPKKNGKFGLPPQ